jgi:hypothetical protein
LKSLRKGAKKHNTKVPKLSQNLHIVAGNHHHDVIHSVAPISATEIEKLESINPEYVNRLFNIMEQSIQTEEKERALYFDAIEREQENDKLSIEKQAELKNNALLLSGKVILGMILSSLIFAYLGHEIIAGAIITTGLVGIVKAILSKNKKK